MLLRRAALNLQCFLSENRNLDLKEIEGIDLAWQIHFQAPTGITEQCGSLSRYDEHCMQSNVKSTTSTTWGPHMVDKK